MGALTLSTASSLNYQQKSYVGCHVEKVHNDKLAYSGVSNNQQPIVVKVNSPTVTATLNAQLILIVDANLVIDFETQQVKLSYI